MATNNKVAGSYSRRLPSGHYFLPAYAAAQIAKAATFPANGLKTYEYIPLVVLTKEQST